MEIIIYIYRSSQTPITTEDCKNVNRLTEKFLDSADEFPSEYYLEVSSPGLTRVLKKECDWEYALKKDIEIKLRETIDKKYFKIGTLLDFDEDKIFIESDGQKLEINRKNVKNAKLFINWGGKHE